MKDLGFTNDGNHIVEMNQEEYGELSKLSSAVEGRAFPEALSYRDYRFEAGFDFSKTFSVIRAYYIARFRLNELKSLMMEIEKALEKKES